MFLCTCIFNRIRNLIIVYWWGIQLRYHLLLHPFLSHTPFPASHTHVPSSSVRPVTPAPWFQIAPGCPFTCAAAVCIYSNYILQRYMYILYTYGDIIHNLCISYWKLMQKGEGERDRRERGRERERERGREVGRRVDRVDNVCAPLGIKTQAAAAGVISSTRRFIILWQVPQIENYERPTDGPTNKPSSNQHTDMRFHK